MQFGTKMNKRLLTLGTSIAALTMVMAPTASLANEFEGELRALAEDQLLAIAQDPIIVNAILAQNEVSASYDQTKIDALDKTWRAEVDSASKPMIDEVLARPASKWLQDVQYQSAGLYTEMFVMDAKGLNVAQGTLTSDYWQGDEDKWQQSFGAGSGAMHFGEIEEDESTQIFQSQLSVTIVNPADNTPIGAITVGVDLAAL